MLPAPLAGRDGRRRSATTSTSRVQRERYRARRELLQPALEAAGFRIDRSEAGLYLWATEGRDAWESIGRLADLGILAGPGHLLRRLLPAARAALADGDRRAHRGGGGAAARFWRHPLTASRGRLHDATVVRGVR